MLKLRRQTRPPSSVTSCDVTARATLEGARSARRNRFLFGGRSLLRSLDWLVRLGFRLRLRPRAQGQDGTDGVAHYRLGHAAEEYTADRALPVRRHHDQIGGDFAGESQDGFRD